jgi:DNA replication protein DnaC
VSGATVRERRPCPQGICDGSGWLLDDDNAARPCSCQAGRESRRRNRGIASTIPPRYRGASLDRPPISDMAQDPETRGAVDQVCEYVEDLGERFKTGRGLWLYGDTGTGKTTLAMLVAKAALEASKSVAVYSLPELLARIRRTYDGDGDSYTTFFDRVVGVDLLYLDDLGAEKRTDWVLEQLYALVNRRYEMERSVMVTTNLSHEDLEAQIGQRTVSRLTQLCDEVPLFGTDRRYGHLRAVNAQ